MNWEPDISLKPSFLQVNEKQCSPVLLKARSGKRNPVYISYDSTNFISSTVQPAVIEPGHAKDGKKMKRQ